MVKNVLIGKNAAGGGVQTGHRDVVRRITVYFA
jgi:hypothetical protein